MISWLVRHFQRSVRATVPRGHMTFGQTSVGRSMLRTHLFMKKQLWVWPLIAVLLLAVIGWTVSSSIERTMKDGLKSQIQTLVRVERAMLESWLATQELSAESLANAPQVRATVTEMLLSSQPVSIDSSSADARASIPLALHSRLTQELGPGMKSHRFVSYFVADKQQRIIAGSDRELIGGTVPRYEAFLTRTLDGESTVSPPFASVVQLKGLSGETRSDTPTMFVAAPIRDSNLQVVAVLALRIRPEQEFTRVLQLGQMGLSGETFAFDKNGLMVSNSRFDEDLILLGILPDTEFSRSILAVSLRDPGGNMKQGFRPKVRRAELPLTKIVAEAVTGKSGVLMDSYNDYRGVPSVGAFEWLPKYGIGLLTEIDEAEAFQPLSILQRTFYGLYGLLAVSSLSIFLFTLVVARLQREAQKSAVEAKQLGQYRLEAKIGSGAMGIVYKGQHAMLRRPTAIKMLNFEKVNEASIKRFEREVQITCK